MTMPQLQRADLKDWTERTAHRYLQINSGERSNLISLFEALDAGVDIGSRHTFPLHLTASAVVIDNEETHILLLQHKDLGIWVQPGGHLARGEHPPEAAERELQEECRLSDAVLCAKSDIPLDIDVHSINANPRKGEPAHFHCDFRYLFRAPHGPISLSRESLDARWVQRGRSLRELTGDRMDKVIRKLDRLSPTRSVAHPC